MQTAIIIVLLPLISFLVIGLMDTRWKARTAGLVGTSAIGLIALLSWKLAIDYFSSGRFNGKFPTYVPVNFEWLKISEKLHIDLGILLDPISIMMLVVISTVSLMVHLYSMGYMKGEKGFERYYAFLSLFSFSMIGLVVATNIFQMYIFWELVGISSYLLIGFYYTKPEAVAASKKAFIVTRFADLGFLLGILLLSYFTGTFDFQTLNSVDKSIFASAAGVTFMGVSALSWATGLIFLGGAGKSAMFPLHIWLPDAMEGPTPVSALIHAATMVVAGVYLVARMFPVYWFYTPDVLQLVAWVGTFTSLFAAVVALVQTDIKRILAFSTISQIGFMMVALGVSGYEGHEGLGYMSSMFHLFTHAMFKALLFLGAGSIIHAIHSNHIDQMGGLRKYLPITHITFLIACLSIAGIWPFSGFFSKDEILSAAFMSNPAIGVSLTVTAGLTAFYMFRLYYKVFWHKTYEVKHGHLPHESGITMTIPLMTLALFTLISGFLPFGEFVTGDGEIYHIHIDPTVATISLLTALTGIVVASIFYFKAGKIPDLLSSRFNNIYRWMLNKFYLDEVWLFVTKKIIFKRIVPAVAWFDKNIIDGVIDGSATGSHWISDKIKGFQSGRVQQYAFITLLSVIIISLIIIFF